ncbi:MAG: hypothetical protein E7294_13480 [Lachnospiraceae bacterium]|nr:hypothetical protein [Lachnospiraceae bacterium]
MEDKKKPFQQYIERTVEIRKLSTPSLEEITNADGYSERLTQNFIRIGELAAQNREFLDKMIFPVLTAGRQLTEDEIGNLAVLADEMINAAEGEFLDMPIAYLVLERVLSEIGKKEDRPALIRCYDLHMSVCYALKIISERMSAGGALAEKFSEEGLKMGEYFLSLLEHETFRQIEDQECRDMILTNARYISAFFLMRNTDPEVNAYDLSIQEHMWKIAEDEFYHKEVPGFDWQYFKFRVLEYISMLGDYGNQRGFLKKELAAICDYTEREWELWHTDEMYFVQCAAESQIEMRLARNRYLAGRSEKKEYRQKLLELYRKRDPKGYTVADIESNIMIPAEYLALLGQDEIMLQDKHVLKCFYRDMLTYAFQMPNSERWWACWRVM